MAEDGEIIGPVPVMLPKEDGSSLVVSNGVGNWFPLRTAAPAEIVHITLRAAPPTELTGR